MDFFLFYHHTEVFYNIAKKGLVDAVIIDLEQKGKQDRQIDYDTEINQHRLGDLEKIRNLGSQKIIVRVNGGKDLSIDEILRSFEAGANEVLIPMIRHPKELEGIFKKIGQDKAIGILIETDEAVNYAAELSQFPIARVYIGLNDLWIDRKSKNIFVPFIDGTISQIRQHFTLPFGIAGTTDPSQGSPIPSILLISEMVRLNCSFIFLRRSFYRDSKIIDPALMIGNIRKFISDIETSSEDYFSNNYEKLKSLILQM